MGKTTKKSANNRNQKVKQDESVAINNKKEEKLIKKSFRKNRDRLAHQYDSQEEKEFQNIINKMNLMIRVMKGDGNCMFRSIADQLIGNENKYERYREIICNYIEKHEDHFKYFIEDDETFPDYLKRMRDDGEWGGQQELYAAAQSLNIDIYIHQVNAPRFVFLCDNNTNTHTTADTSISYTTSHRSIHLSFHGECHYNSVRLLSDDTYDQPTVHIKLPSPDDSSTNTLATAATITTSTSTTMTATTAFNNNKNKLMETVSNSVPWASFEDIKIALEMTENEIDDTIEVLMANPNGLSKSVNLSTSSTNNEDDANYIATTCTNKDDKNNRPDIKSEIIKVADKMKATKTTVSTSKTKNDSNNEIKSESTSATGTVNTTTNNKKSSISKKVSEINSNTTKITLSYFSTMYVFYTLLGCSKAIKNKTNYQDKR